MARPLRRRGLAPAARASASTADYRHYLQDLRRFKPYTLDEKSEQIINIKDENGIDAVMTLYSMLTNRLEFNLEVDGETQKLTRDELMSHAFSPSARAARAAAYQELYRVYSQEATVLGQIYANRVRDWHDEQVGLRGYTSPIAVRNLDNDIPDRAVEVLLEVARENAPLFQRYFRLKAELAGPRPAAALRPLRPARHLGPQDRLRRRGALGARHLRRLPSRLRRPWPSGCSPRTTSTARSARASGAAPSAPRCCRATPPGCWSTTPAGCATWRPSPTSSATPSTACWPSKHSSLTQHASLPLAETASVFGEMLMTDRLLREEPDPLARRELLAAAVDDVYATVLRQAYFVLFELEAHDADPRGPLDRRAVASSTWASSREQFGDSVELPPEFRYEWLSIPHIYQTPFYCYAYSFGQLLVLALYRRYQEEGEAFKPGYMQAPLLRRLGAPGARSSPRSGSTSPTARFWQGGFDLVRERIDELEAMKL